MPDSYVVDIKFSFSRSAFEIAGILLHDYDEEKAKTIINTTMPKYFTSWYDGMLVTASLRDLIEMEVRHVLKNGLDNAVDRLDDLDRTKRGRL